MRIKILIISTIFFSINFISGAQIRESKEKNIKKSLSFLASDKMKGRAAGSEQDKKSALFIAKQLKKYGYKPLFDNNPLVPFTLNAYRYADKDSRMIVNDAELEEMRDFIIIPYSRTTNVRSTVCNIEKETNLDTLNLQGKIAMIETVLDSVPFKITKLIDRGAIGLIFYNDKMLDVRNKFFSAPLFSIPIARVTKNIAEQIKNNPSKTVEINSVLGEHIATSWNVVMKIDVPDVESSIIIGAHHDHLGLGGKYSGSRKPDVVAVHNGADDNASGISAVLEIARILSEHKGQLKHDIVIASFGAEEKGIIGSRIIADTLEKINKSPILMVNLDMVGRLRDNNLQIGGIGTFEQADSLIRTANEFFNFNLATTKDGYGPSDHASFYTKEVPVLYFTTGVHNEYHTPEDDIELINFSGMARVTDFITSILSEVAFSGLLPKYIKIERAAQPTMKSFKVTLGIIPDFTYEKGDGFRIGSVTGGKPADKAGLKANDIIIAIDSKKITNIYDYMDRLSEMQTGESYFIDVLRNGKLLKLSVDL